MNRRTRTYHLDPEQGQPGRAFSGVPRRAREMTDHQGQGPVTSGTSGSSGSVPRNEKQLYSMPPGFPKIKGGFPHRFLVENDWYYHPILLLLSTTGAVDPARTCGLQRADALGVLAGTRHRDQKPLCSAIGWRQAIRG